MNFQSHGACFYLFDQRFFIGAVSFSKESQIHGIFFCRFQHHLHIPGARCTGGGVGSVRRPRSASDHGGNAGVQCTVNLLGTDKMNMGINSSCRYDHSFPRQRLCRRAHGHSRSYAIHNGRVPRFSNTFDFSVLNSDICFHDAGIIYNQCIGNHQIQIPIAAAGLYRLAHSIPDGFSSSEFDFLPIGGIIFFHFYHKIRISQTNFVSRCRAVHHCIFFSRKFYAHSFFPPVILSILSVLLCPAPPAWLPPTHGRR